MLGGEESVGAFIFFFFGASGSMRCRCERKPWSRKNARTSSSTGFFACKLCKGGSSISVIKVTRICERRASSTNSLRFSANLPFSSAGPLSKTASRSPYFSSKVVARFGPTPLTPGILSDESPTSACQSLICSGGTPNFSFTSVGPIFLFGSLGFGGGHCQTCSPTTCARSLSELYKRTSISCPGPWAAMDAIRSSAS